jgi:glutathione S-transferase
MPYREERHVQGVHQLVARRVSGGMTVPVLVTPDGVIGESAEILAWVDQRTPPEHRLLPSESGAREEVERLCRRLDEVLGQRGRRLMYVHMLADPKLALCFNNAGVPGWEDRFIRYGWPVAKRYVKRVLEIRPGIEIEDEMAVFGELDYVAELLRDGRPYLCGERFGAADLTFASLSASVIVPPAYGVPLPQPDVLSPGMSALVQRATRAPRRALRAHAVRRAPKRDNPLNSKRASSDCLRLRNEDCS